MNGRHTQVVSKSILVVALCGLSTPLLAQSSNNPIFVADVVDASTGDPLAGADVLVLDVGRLVRSDGAGEARVAGIPAGRHRVRVRRLGYAAADVELLFQADSTTALFKLEPVQTELDTVRVVARATRPHLREFETRRSLGIGRFLTESDLSRAGDEDFAQLVAVRFPGLQARTDQEGKRHIVSLRGSCGGDMSHDRHEVPRLGGMNGRGGVGGGGAGSFGSCTNDVACPVRVFLDGMDLGQDELNIVRTWDLAGVEYYTGASMPAQYRLPGTGCGLLLLWSRW